MKIDDNKNVIGDYYMFDVRISLSCNGNNFEDIEISNAFLRELFNDYADDMIENNSNDSCDESIVLDLFSNYIEEAIDEILEKYNDEIEELLDVFFEEELRDAKRYREIYPCGFFPDPYLFGPDTEKVYQAFDKANKVEAKLIVNGRSSVAFDVDITSILVSVVERAVGDAELYDQNTGYIILDFLEAFINEGMWHIGLINDKNEILTDSIDWPHYTVQDNKLVWVVGQEEFEPIIWFGLEGEQPISCWSLNRERNYLTALSDGDYFPYYNWNAIFNGEGGGIIDWTFCEAYESGPSPQRLIDTCPIRFFDDDVVEYFAKMQDGASFKSPIQFEFVIKNNVLMKFKGDEQDITIPRGVIELGEIAFAGSKIERCIIPEGVTKIGFNTFRNCRELKEVYLPNTLSFIDKNAFCNCSSLKTIILPDSIKYIMECAFRGCSSLKEMRIPSGVGWINSGTFQECGSLEKIYIPWACNVVGQAFDYSANKGKGCKIIKYKTL